MKSMTGFARTSGQLDIQQTHASWQWELRSVNGRGLDLRMRLPAGHEDLEPAVRKAAGERLARGNVQISLQLALTGGGDQIFLNKAAFERAMEIGREAGALYGTDAADLDALLRMRGVIETREAALDDEARQQLHKALVKDFHSALDEITAVRGHEGAQMRDVLLEIVTTFETHCAGIQASPSRKPETIRARLGEQLSRLIDDGADRIDSARLHQELALLATKSDIAEELARLDAHCETVRDLLDSDEPVGRRLDFLSQELNREANTICSKSTAIDVTNHGMELKVLVDQFREQVQNVE